MRAPVTSVPLIAPVATLNPVPRTASVELGVTTLKSFFAPTLSTWKSARPDFICATVRYTSPSLSLTSSEVGIAKFELLSIKIVAFSNFKVIRDRSPVRTSAPAESKSLTAASFASFHAMSAPARHFTLPTQSITFACSGADATVATAGTTAALIGEALDSWSGACVLTNGVSALATSATIVVSDNKTPDAVEMKEYFEFIWLAFLRSNRSSMFTRTALLGAAAFLSVLD